MAVILIERVRGDVASREEVDPARLLRTDGLVDNDREHTTIVEYCWLSCLGPAHTSGIPDAPSHFCNLHVHRSVVAVLKQGLEGLGGLGTFGDPKAVL